MRRALVVVTLLGLALVTNPPPASAAIYASNGLRCTKVGTSGADRISGTSYRDVICGLGGDDVINGRGGDDVIDGGAGNDGLYGADGNDLLLGGLGGDLLSGGSGVDIEIGGAGNDKLYGGPGADVLSGLDGYDYLDGGDQADKEYGGTGNDRLVGGAGDDTLSGDLGNDTLYGGYGNDRVYGAAGTDVLSGQDGADYLSGGDDADKEYGGAGNDTIAGGNGDDSLSGDLGNDAVSGGYGDDKVYGAAGTDVLSGQDGADYLSGGDDADKESGGAGNDTLLGDNGDDVLGGDGGDDDLSGQGGSNTLAGGDGTNWCTVGSTDSQTGCVYDEAAPTVATLTVTPGEVDVTEADAIVTVRVRILDDTGVARIQLWSEVNRQSMDPRLVSGTIRDGVWEGTTRIRRYMLPKTYDIYLYVWDRVGRETYVVRSGVLAVHDDTPDSANPVVDSAVLDTSAVDVRGADAAVRSTVHVTDDLAGVDGVDVCLMAPDGDGNYRNYTCDAATIVAGTRTSGTWVASAVIQRGSAGGDWNVVVWVQDAAHVGPDGYFGPDYSRWQRSHWAGDPLPYWHDLPGGVGRLSVTGTTDSTPAQVTFVRTDRTQVDTLPADQTVNVDVHAVDVPAEGVTGVVVTLIALDTASDSSAPSQPWLQGALVSGTDVDGWWRVTITLPQGTPPGRYGLGQVMVEDKGHWRSYEPPSWPYTWHDASSLPLEPSQLGTPDGGPWDGVITVVQSGS